MGGHDVSRGLARRSCRRMVGHRRTRLMGHDLCLGMMVGRYHREAALAVFCRVGREVLK